MSTCEGAKTATAKIINVEGKPLLVATKNPPISVEKDSINGSLITYSGDSVGVPCYEPSSWLDPLSPAVWVWSAATSSPQEKAEETASFSKQFQAVKNQEFSLVCACDNKAEIIFNGENIGSAENFSSLTNFTLTAVEGTNTITFNCTNYPNDSTDPYVNPAGLYFRLSSAQTCKIQVTDKNGVIYEKQFTPCPEVEINCDDECPEGQLKCSSNKFPGYCCLPCKETANKIRELGAKLQ